MCLKNALKKFFIISQAGLRGESRHERVTRYLEEQDAREDAPWRSSGFRIFH
jgi:hypothetical protein